MAVANDNPGRTSQRNHPVTTSSPVPICKEPHRISRQFCCRDGDTKLGREYTIGRYQSRGAESTEDTHRAAGDGVRGKGVAHAHVASNRGCRVLVLCCVTKVLQSRGSPSRDRSEDERCWIRFSPRIRLAPPGLWLRRRPQPEARLSYIARGTNSPADEKCRSLHHLR